MSTAALVPVSEYLSTSYHPDCEYVDGIIVERNVGEWDHSRTQMSVSGYLFIREKQLGILVAPEQRVQVLPARFRVPDVVVLLAEPDGQIIRRPPFLCIEILSKDDTLNALREKIDEYLAFGVSYIWVLEPWTKKAYIYSSDGMREVRDGVLRTANPEITVPLSEIFR